MKPPALAKRPAAPPRAATLRFSGLNIALGFGLLLLSAWAAGSTYLLFAGNRLAGSAINRTFQLQDYYEQQGAEFRRVVDAHKAETERARRELARVEQIVSDRASVESKLVELVRRQGQIETRQSALVRLTEQLNGVPITAAQQAISTPVPPIRPRRPGATRGLEATRSVLGMGAVEEEIELDPDAELLREAEPENHGMAEEALGEARAVRRPVRPVATPVSATPPLVLPEGRSLEIAENLLQRLRALEATQLRSVQALSESTANRASLLRQATEVAGRELADIVEPSRLKAIKAVATLAKTAAEDGSPYGVALGTIRQNVSVIRRLMPVVSALPLRQPVEASRISSRFGTRSDPFLGTSRFHAGQDFAAATGSPIYSTGGGTVLSAGPAGGYGNLVQVSHGNGLVTRYAHLSEILVAPGQPVSAGQLVGKAGSTGRSTGPHLHYETRLNNVPNDPMRLLRVGAQLGVVQGPNATVLMQTK